MIGRRISVALIAVAAVSVTSALVSPATATPTATVHGRGGGLDGGTRAAIDKIVEQSVGTGGSPGMAVAVSTPEGSYRQAYGVANVATGAPFRLTDHVRIASITKTFTATVILQMVDRKMIRLDDRLGSYVSGVPNGDVITIRQVLAMSAGIYDYTSDAEFDRDLAANPLLRFSTADFFAVLHRHPPAYAPGTMTVYSDSNYYLLSLVAQKITGQSLGTLIERWILNPLRMCHTVYPTRPNMPRPFAHGYLPAEGSAPRQDVTRTRPELSYGAGAMISTVDDLTIWARALARGTLLSRRTQAERLRFAPLSGVTSPLSIGYGLGVFEIQGFIGHNGAILGYSSAMFYRPDKDATIVVIGNQSTNSTTPTTTVFVEIAKQLYPDLFPRL
jgi:D-alanyl-D-alanine carboxypeptidase